MLTPDDLKDAEKWLRERHMLLEKLFNLGNLRDDIPPTHTFRVSIRCIQSIQDRWLPAVEWELGDIPERGRIIDIVLALMNADLRKVEAKLTALGIAPDGKPQTPPKRKGPRLRLAE